MHVIRVRNQVNDAVVQSPRSWQPKRLLLLGFFLGFGLLSLYRNFERFKPYLVGIKHFSIPQRNFRCVEKVVLRL